MPVDQNSPQSNAEFLNHLKENTVPVEPQNKKAKKPKPRRSRGGQPGNQNARTHGFRELCAPEVSEPPSGLENREGYSGELARKRGGQPGNQNARTHGFYARRLPLRALEGLEDTTVRSLEDEIGVMRVFSRKVAELGAGVEELDEAKSVLNTLSNATGSINRLVRTHTRIPDPLLDPAALLRRALEELEEEWPELKKFGDTFRTAEQIRALDERLAAKKAAREQQNSPTLPAAPSSPALSANSGPSV